MAASNPYLHYFDKAQSGKPVFNITANGRDITRMVQDRLLDLVIDDESGLVSDKLSIRLDDRDNALLLPPELVKFDVSLGYERMPLMAMGSYVMDEVTFDVAPDTVSFSGLSADMVQSLKSQKKRAWDNVKLGALLTQIAKEHGLTPAIAPAFNAIQIDHLDQTYESDLNIITRLADQYGAVAKPAGGSLVFVRKGDGLNANGAALPAVTIQRTGVIGASARWMERSQFLRVGAHWGNYRGNHISYVYAGSGAPVKFIRTAFKSARDAQTACAAELARLKRGRTELSLELVGNPMLCAEMPLILQGFRQEMNGEWIVTKATHRLSSGGFTTSISAQRREDFERTEQE
jgi:hypothetical protein